jgi:hypothetical protein
MESTEFMELRVRPSGRLLQKLKWIFGLNKRQGVYRLAEELLASDVWLQHEVNYEFISYLTGNALLLH